MHVIYEFLSITKMEYFIGMGHVSIFTYIINIYSNQFLVADLALGQVPGPRGIIRSMNETFFIQMSQFKYSPISFGR